MFSTAISSGRIPVTSRQLACFLSSNRGNLPSSCWPNKSWSHASQQSKRAFLRLKILPTDLKCFGSLTQRSRTFFFLLIHMQPLHVAHCMHEMRSDETIWNVVFNTFWWCKAWAVMEMFTQQIGPTYFTKFTCLNRIEHEKSTEHAKDPWNRRGKSSDYWRVGRSRQQP